MVWRYACGFFRILKLFFITGFLLQYLGKWYRTNGPLVNLPIFNSSNKNKAGDINSLWNFLVSSVSSHSFIILFLPCPSLSSPLLSLLSFFSLSLGHDTKWPTRVDVLLNPNTINPAVELRTLCSLCTQAALLSSFIACIRYLFKQQLGKTINRLCIR